MTVAAKRKRIHFPAAVIDRRYRYYLAIF